VEQEREEIRDDEAPRTPPPRTASTLRRFCLTFKVIEANPLNANGDLRQMLSHFAVKAITIHAE
jgi:hypothetical protein